MHRLRKSWPPLPEEALEDVWSEIIKLNRFSDITDDNVADSKNKKLFRNIQRLNNSPRPTEDTQLD